MPDDVISRLTTLGMPEGEEPPPLSYSEPGTVLEGIVPLGHDRGVFYYLSRSAKQVFGIPAERHSRNMLMAMASVAHYWQRTRFVGDKGQIRWDEATDDLMEKCRSVGIFDPDKIRGRGAWLDRGRAVLHIGNRLIVDGAPAGGLMLADSPFVYEAGKPLSHVNADPLSTAEAHKLVEICKSLRWERGISGLLLAGFIVIAPVCGALAWRPSVWVTGASGSGKSWAEENVVAPLIGGMALRVQSKTSEAGIRQKLGTDALPVMFDEAEREDESAASRMQGVLDLLRQSSSETGAEIIKGSQGHAAKRFRIRSCFYFSSINVGIEHKADENRLTVLSLRSPASDDDTEAKRQAVEQFKRLRAAVSETVTPEFAAGLLARTVKLLPIIRRNAETFAEAVALHFGDRRLGDQLGTLLAGVYSVHSSGEITPEKAAEFIAKQEWAETVEADVEQDELRLLSHLTQTKIGIAPGNGARVEATLGRLIEAAAGKDRQIVSETAELELNQIGIRYAALVVGKGQDPRAPKGVHISNTHPALKRLLNGTPWSAGWARSLRRIVGATPSEAAVRFGPGHQARSVWLPMEAISPAEKRESRDEMDDWALDP